MQSSFNSRAQRRMQQQRQQGAAADQRADPFDDDPPHMERPDQRQAQQAQRPAQQAVQESIGTHIEYNGETYKGTDLIEAYVESQKEVARLTDAVTALRENLQRAQSALGHQQKSGGKAMPVQGTTRGARIAIFFITIAAMLIGIRLMLIDTNFSTIALAEAGLIPADWNVGNWDILWGMFGKWSPWFLIQSLISAIQLTLMPIHWRGLRSKSGTVQFPFEWINVGFGMITPTFGLGLFVLAFFFNIGSTYIGVSADMVNWKPIKVFTVWQWPTEGAGHIFISFMFACFLGLVGERTIVAAYQAIMKALADKFWK